MGRPPLPTALKELRGSFAKNPQRRNQSEPVADVAAPVCPRSLTPAAKAEWKRVTKELLSLRVLTEADRAAVQQYCETWGQLRELQEIVKKDGLIQVGDNGRLYEHPAARMAARCESQIHKYLVQLGLTPAARSRVNATPVQKPTRMRRQR